MSCQRTYARPRLDKHRLGELIDLIGTILLVSPRPRAGGEGQGQAVIAEASHRSKGILGRVYQYFLTQFASAEGKNGGQFDTPSCVVRCLRADYVLANGSMSSNQSGEGDIRRALIEAHLVDCMVALPGQLFYSTKIPVCL